MNSEGLGEDELGDVILDVVDYQLAMALHGFFVRGGIAYGPLHVSNHVVFGPALLDAHDIEESVARYPRVVLARDVVKIARYHLRFYHPFGDSPHNTTLLVADDRRVFVNYLCGLILDQGVQWDALLRHATTFAAHFMNAKWSPPMRSSTFW